MTATLDDNVADVQRADLALQRQLSEVTAERDKAIAERSEALRQQTATAEVLQVINASPGVLAGQQAIDAECAIDRRPSLAVEKLNE
jgi:hypothetical protein